MRPKDFDLDQPKDEDLDESCYIGDYNDFHPDETDEEFFEHEDFD